MPWGAVGAIGGALISSNATQDAASTQADSAAAATAEQQREYDQNRADNAPALAARNAGLSGYQSLLSNPSSITSDPGYQFGLTQGVAGIDASAASKGGLYSGATLKALNRYGQDYGSTKYDAALSRYSTLAGLGNPGAAAISSAGEDLGNQISSNLLGVGNTQGAADLNSGRTWANTANLLGSMAKNTNWGNAFAPAVTNGSDANGFNGTQNNPSAYVASN